MIAQNPDITKKPPLGGFFVILFVSIRRLVSFAYSYVYLQHLHINRNSRRKREIGERLNEIRHRIDNIYQSLMHSHLKLFARVFVDERRTIDPIFLNLSRKRNRPLYDCVKS